MEPCQIRVERSEGRQDDKEPRNYEVTPGKCVDRRKQVSPATILFLSAQEDHVKISISCPFAQIKTPGAVV